MSTRQARSGGRQFAWLPGLSVCEDIHPCRNEPTSGIQHLTYQMPPTVAKDVTAVSWKLGKAHRGSFGPRKLYCGPSPSTGLRVAKATGITPWCLHAAGAGPTTLIGPPRPGVLHGFRGGGGEFSVWLPQECVEPFCIHQARNAVEKWTDAREKPATDWPLTDQRSTEPPPKRVLPRHGKALTLMGLAAKRSLPTSAAFSPAHP